MNTLPIPFDSNIFYDFERLSIALIWVIRDKGPLTFEQLRKFIVANNRALQTHEIYSTREVLLNLYKNEIIRIEGDSAPKTLQDVEDVFRSTMMSTLPGMIFRTSSRLAFVQKTFNVSLSELLDGDQFVRTRPIFGKPMATEPNKFARVFVLMPFAESMKPIYEDHIQPVCKRLTLTCKRGDNFFSSDSIIEEVWSSIYHAEVCIADCTGRNPNVFYELGVSHTLGRQTILIAQSIDDIPFDIRHLRTIIYTYSPPGMKVFAKTLGETLQSVLKH